MDQSSTGEILTWEEIEEFFVFQKGDMSSDSCNSGETRLYEDMEGSIEIIPGV